MVWRGEDVLIAPSGALFREGASWSAVVVEDGRAVRRKLEIGRRGGLETEVLSGLGEGEQVVLYPSELIEPGAAVEVRYGARRNDAFSPGTVRYRGHP